MANVYQCYYFIHYESNICIEKEEKVHCSELAFFVQLLKTCENNLWKLIKQITTYISSRNSSAEKILKTILNNIFYHLSLS